MGASIEIFPEQCVCKRGTVNNVIVETEVIVSGAQCQMNPDQRAAVANLEF